MNITIQTPYAQADRYTGIWANEEERINFRKEPDRALRCTISFAAMQLKEYLLKTLSHASITFSNQTAADTDRKSTRLNSSHSRASRMPSSA